MHVSPVVGQCLIFFTFFFFLSRQHVKYSNLLLRFMIVRGRLITQTIHRTYIIYMYTADYVNIPVYWCTIRFGKQDFEKKIYYNIHVYNAFTTVVAAAGDRCGSVKNMIYSTKFSLRALVLLLLTYIIFSTAYRSINIFFF